MAGVVVASAKGSITVELTNQGQVRVTLPVTGIAPAVGDPITVGLRPEHFGVAEAVAGDASITLDIDVAEHLGATSYIYANTKSGEQIIVEREESRYEDDRENITVSIDTAKAFLFDGKGQRIR